MRLQPVYDIAELCARREVTQAVLCPGSRCAPLTLALARHPSIKTYTITDERSAAFIALGMAQRNQRASLLVCTSGSAAYNFAPAVAEAFFANTPLIIFTADRPAEWIAQHDGQTIYQAELFGPHVKKSFQLPQDYDHADSHWAINRMVNEAISVAHAAPAGPVHINVPLREPLYPATGEIITFGDTIRVMRESSSSRVLPDEAKISLLKEWTSYHRVLVASGQHTLDTTLLDSLRTFSTRHHIPVTGDIISNLHPLHHNVGHAESILGNAPDGVLKTLKPDLLITFGQSVISKNLKLFIRKHKPTAHWHVQAEGPVADPFQSITQVIRTSPADFFSFLADFNQGKSFENQKQQNYFNLWEIEERRIRRTLETFFPTPELSELDMVHEIIKRLPDGASLHLANSMSVRYANLVGLAAHQQVEVFSNRGTSGIDGCTSTAVGHALASPDTPHVLITGDLAFFYDRNAFWHTYAVPNLHIVVLNNHGGIIFNMIDGPSQLEEAAEYFVTNQRLTAAKLCEEFGFDYLKLDSRRKVKNLLTDFFTFDGSTRILEIETGIPLNKQYFENLKDKIKESYEL